MIIFIIFVTNYSKRKVSESSVVGGVQSLYYVIRQWHLCMIHFFLFRKVKKETVATPNIERSHFFGINCCA